MKAYRDETFLNSPNARSIRILAEYLELESRFEKLKLRDTIVFLGSSRTLPRQQAAEELDAAQAGNGDLEAAQLRLHMSRYYEDSRELARRLTEWSKNLEGTDRRFVVCTGGGPGVMSAANQGASEAKGLNIGLNISLPEEQPVNPHVTRQLDFEFHYFFMRKFWFVYLAKAIVVMPGGFGTMDELFEVLTLMQTRKTKRKLPMVLYGNDFWEEVVNFPALVKYGVIDAEDMDLFLRTDSLDEAYAFLVRELTEYALGHPEPTI